VRRTGTDPAASDTDADGLQDGTELGTTIGVADPDGPGGPMEGTDAAAFVPDADPASTTNPLDRDSDDGGVGDGNEDVDHDGQVDAGETNPVAGNGADDLDPDGDGLPSSVELLLGRIPPTRTRTATDLRR